MALTGDEKEELQKKYFNYVNNELPQELLPGIEKAMEIYKGIYDENGGFQDDEDGDGAAVCFIIDGSTMAFAVGDGLDVDGPDDDAIFYKFECKMLETCASWVIDTEMNLRQEQGHWLGDCITLAAEEGVFDHFENFCVYGDNGYGAGSYDVFYEAYGDDDDDWDDEDDDWDDDDD